MTSHKTVQSSSRSHDQQAVMRKAGPAVQTRISAGCPRLRVAKLLHKLFVDAVEFRNYHVLKILIRYEDDETNDLDKISNKTTVEMKKRTVNSEKPG